MTRILTTIAIIASLSGSATAQQMTGEQAVQVYSACLKQASKECRRNTMYCRGFRQSYVKTCMIKNNVPPDYIMLLVYG